MKRYYAEHLVMNNTENSIHLVGYLGSDPVIRWYDPETCVATLSIATNEHTYLTEEGIECDGDSTDWHRVICYRAVALKVADAMVTGDKIAVAGRLTYRKWYNARGEEHISAIIIAHDVELINKKQPPKASIKGQEKTKSERYRQYFETLSENTDGLPF